MKNRMAGGMDESAAALILSTGIGSLVFAGEAVFLV